MLVFALVLLLIMACGATIVGETLRVKDLLYRFVVGCSVGLCLFLQFVNGLESLGLSTPQAGPVGGAMLLILAIVVGARGRSPLPERWAIPSRLRVGVWLGLVLVFVLTAAAHNRSGDDDFWIHGPLQGLLARGGLLSLIHI